jgi:hypothetical protein
MYRQVLAREPNDIDAMNGMAVCYDRLGQFEVSRAYYEAALGMQPQSPMLLNNYGYSLFLQGDMDGAKALPWACGGIGRPGCPERKPAHPCPDRRCSGPCAEACAAADYGCGSIGAPDRADEQPRAAPDAGRPDAPPQMVASLGAEAAALSPL